MTRAFTLSLLLATQGCSPSGSTTEAGDTQEGGAGAVPAPPITNPPADPPEDPPSDPPPTPEPPEDPPAPDPPSDPPAPPADPPAPPTDPAPPEDPPPETPPDPPPPVSGADVQDTFADEQSVGRFLSQATFGAQREELSALVGSSTSDWFKNQLSLEASDYLTQVRALLAQPNATVGGQPTNQGRRAPNHAFWQLVISADDQLRQRMAFALSQILVISNNPSSTLFDWPEAVGYYQNLLSQHALGNYRELLEAVTYSPAMGEYLTFIKNRKASETRTPDENYAREIMQLFTIGLEALNEDGTPRLVNGSPIESYSNSDVTGLARVFTGLSLEGNAFFFGFNEVNSGAQALPMKVFPEHHSEREKRFLGVIIPAQTGATESISMALDALIAHPNTAPFLARQLIQRFVTSHPKPDYVARVAAAFVSGRHSLPDGSVTGSGTRGDLAATLAAILFDREARLVELQDTQFGKLREPVLRFTQWSRAFQVTNLEPALLPDLDNAPAAEALSQAPYQSPSVFNFFRPFYVAPGTATGSAGLTAPELQLVNANSVYGYANFMTSFIFGDQSSGSAERNGVSAFQPDYQTERELADDPEALVAHLDLLLNSGATDPVTQARIIEVLQSIPMEASSNFDGAEVRISYAIAMLMSAPSYLTQR